MTARSFIHSLISQCKPGPPITPAAPFERTSVHTTHVNVNENGNENGNENENENEAAQQQRKHARTHARSVNLRRTHYVWVVKTYYVLGLSGRRTVLRATYRRHWHGTVRQRLGQRRPRAAFATVEPEFREQIRCLGRTAARGAFSVAVAAVHATARHAPFVRLAALTRYFISECLLFVPLSAHPPVWFVVACLTRSHTAVSTRPDPTNPRTHTRTRPRGQSSTKWLRWMSSGTIRC